MKLKEIYFEFCVLSTLFLDNPGITDINTKLYYLLSNMHLFCRHLHLSATTLRQKLYDFTFDEPTRK